MWGTIVTWLHKKLCGDSSLHSAVKSFEGDISLVKSLLEEDSSQVNVCNSNGESPLHLALQNKRFSFELIELLVEHGADVKATTARDGNTALHWLATSDITGHGAGIHDNSIWLPEGEDELAERGRLNVAVAKILLEHGSDVNARNLEGDSPLHSAIRSFEGDTRLVKYLLDHDVHDGSQLINARNLKDESPLYLAIQQKRCSEELVELLLERGADVRATTARDGNTALHWLATSDIGEHRSRTDQRIYIFGSHQIGNILLEHGSDGNARNFNGDTPLHLAVQQRRRIGCPPVDAFLRHGLDVNATNNQGDTPFHLNLTTQVHNLDEFLDKTKDINAVNSKGETPLHLAVRNWRCSYVKIKMLLDRGAEVSKRDAMGENAYEAYCRSLDLDIAQKKWSLMDSLRSLFGWTNKETRRANPMLRILLQAKEQEYMDSSLHVACLFHKVDSVHRLLRMGADVNALGNFPSPPLIYALTAFGDVGKCSTLRLMLDYGADINQMVPCNPDGYSVLKYAVNDMVTRGILFEHLAKRFALHNDRQLENLEVLSQYNRDYLSSIGIKLDRYLTGKIDGYDWLSRCSEEVKAMSETEVGESGLSFLDLLLASAEETATYAKNKELVKAFHAKKAMFPIYQGMLDAKLARDLEHRELLESAAAAMSDALSFADPSDEFFERTLSYCSNEDLAHMIEAME